MISERPAEAGDRAVPGHWEGDLIIGKDCKSAVGTLVERTTRYVLLLHLPAGRDAHLVEQAMRQAITALPADLARTITWDQGKEMAYHADFTIATGIPVYFCDPHCALAARLQREHQRPAAPVPAQRHRPVRALRRGSRPHRRQPQQPAPQDARIHETIGKAHRAPCAHRLKPPCQASSGTAQRVGHRPVRIFSTSSRARRARRTGCCRTYKGAARSMHWRRRGGSTVRNWLAPFGSGTFPVAGPAALRPCRATAAPGSRRTRGDRRDGRSAACPALARDDAKGPSLRRPDPETLQVRHQARLFTAGQPRTLVTRAVRTCLVPRRAGQRQLLCRVRRVVSSFRYMTKGSCCAR